MAIAGLHNVDILESTILRESQSSSLGRRRNRGSISTRASSILRMWRELEDECLVNRARERERPRFDREGNDGLSGYREGGITVGLEDSSESENGYVANSESQIGHLNEQEDHQSLTSEQSQDLGEVERERVRKIFREWMSSGGNAETPNVGHINRVSRAQRVGENERERVRVVRDWIQMTSQQREACVGSREDQVAEIASQIEQVCNRQAFNHNEVQSEYSRRQIRIRGRQTLLDLLAKKEQERREELQCLVGTRPVSGFAHRNRIQSLLRLRCMQNRRRSTELRRPSSAAESELGLLRQRQTVAGLREGFMSRLDNNAHVQASDVSDSSSDNDSDAFRDDRSQANCVSEVLDGAHEENDLVGNVDVDQSTDSPSVDLGAGPTVDSDHPTVNIVEVPVEGRLECDTVNIVESRPETATSVRSNGTSDDGVGEINSQESSRRGSRQFTVLEETHEIVDEDYSDREEDNLNNELDDQIEISENLNVDELNVPEENWQEQVLEYERAWENIPFSDQWRDDQVETDRLRWPGDGEEPSNGVLEIEGEEQIHQENYWHESGSLETPRDWLGMVSGSRLASDRVDTYYYSDDDNVHHIELRELVNRRRVSSLLHSDFRESLDQLIQSYVERQTNAHDDWELHEMLPPFVSRNQERLHTELEYETDDVRVNVSERPLPPRPPPLPQAHWGRGTHQTNWVRQELRQRPGTKWEIINDLRIDMARLHHRFSNMQRMLEACMDMQLELQRSVRQEVSAALNRSINPSEFVESVLPKDSLKWDSVKKGVCCICSNTNIDSLLYRCGHMCTCTKCADILVQGNGKCPMCQAPVIEVIRAYFIQ
ncbi:hypothetical protein RND81_09G101100 [Saponaria officinalis]|uniref:RING-type domain-containing protein n=1 Tax=Saponaria officinalis TaxID=3572 RepID=A0AAW1IL41_SAPOF